MFVASQLSAFLEINETYVSVSKWFLNIDKLPLKLQNGIPTSSPSYHCHPFDASHLRMWISVFELMLQKCLPVVHKICINSNFPTFACFFVNRKKGRKSWSFESFVKIKVHNERSSFFRCCSSASVSASLSSMLSCRWSWWCWWRGFQALCSLSCHLIWWKDNKDKSGLFYPFFC